MRFDDLVGRDVVIWGAGREGRAAFAALRQRHVPATFAITGGGAAPTDLGTTAAVGDDALPRLLSADVVIKSPGVPRTADEHVALRAQGVPITSLTDLWLDANAERVLAVTGTKGKSTTSSIAHHLLRSAGIPASLVGNGGTPVTEGDTDESLVAVTEVSSYQAADLSVSPRVAVVTSLYPEHLPWHGGYEQYVADKLNLVAHDPELVVVPDLAGDLADLVRTRVGGATSLVSPSSVGVSVSPDAVTWAGVGRLDAADVPLSGLHNLTNAALALTAVAVGHDDVTDRGSLLSSLGSVAPLAHRLEPVPSRDGRRWVDDSLATAPEAVVAALETFRDLRVTLILGGADRGLSFAPLREYLRRRDSGHVAVVATGPAGERWLREGGPDTELVGGFDEAMELVHRDVDGSDVVLLSPGAPSFDEFASYVERSAAFRSAASHAGSEDRA